MEVERMISTMKNKKKMNTKKKELDGIHNNIVKMSNYEKEYRNTSCHNC